MFDKIELVYPSKKSALIDGLLIGLVTTYTVMRSREHRTERKHLARVAEVQFDNTPSTD